MARLSSSISLYLRSPTAARPRRIPRKSKKERESAQHFKTEIFYFEFSCSPPAPRICINIFQPYDRLMFYALLFQIYPGPGVFFFSAFVVCTRALGTEALCPVIIPNLCSKFIIFYASFCVHFALNYSRSWTIRCYSQMYAARQLLDNKSTERRM